jgi:S1-C subfamily serine protease
LFFGGYGLGGYGYGYGYSYPYYNYGYSYPYNGYDNSQGYAAPSSSPAVYASPAQGRYLGIDELPLTDSSGSGMKVAHVYAGSAAEQAGLQVGDVIYSANGYTTQQPGNLAWIIATVPPNGTLQMTVRSGRDGAVRAVNAQLP